MQRSTSRRRASPAGVDDSRRLEVWDLPATADVVDLDGLTNAEEDPGGVLVWPVAAHRWARTVSEELLYFTWPDRGVRYTCAGCARVLQGHGIGLDVTGGQLVQLVARRPQIAAFLRRRGDTITAFNPRDRCWFLEDDGLCRIESRTAAPPSPATAGCSRSTACSGSARTPWSTSTA